MDPKKLINFREVSLVLTGNKNTVRSNRPNTAFSEPVNELLKFLDKWVKKNSKDSSAVVTIKEEQK